MLEIYVQPEDVWEYFLEHKARLAEQLDVIAEIKGEDDEDGLQVFLTEESDYPLLSIEFGDDVIEKECAVSKIDCMTVARKLYKMTEEYKELYIHETQQYSDVDIVTDLMGDCSVCEGDYEHSIARENELLQLLENFVLEAMGLEEGDMKFEDGSLTMLLDDIEDCIYRDIDCVIYRPRMIQDVETGSLRIIDSIFDLEEG